MSVIILSCIILTGIMLSVVILSVNNAESPYANGHILSVIMPCILILDAYAQLHNAEYSSAECHHPECCHA
jgi:hypothetical protein